MNNEQLLKYSPIAIVVIGLLVSWNMFARPVDIEQTHRLIMVEMSEKYVTKEEFKTQKEEFKDMKTKIDKIYDILIGQKR